MVVLFYFDCSVSATGTAGGAYGLAATAGAAGAEVDVGAGALTVERRL